MEQDKERLRTDLRNWGRRALQEVWRRRQGGERMKAEETRLASILADHPEFASAWESGADLEDTDTRIGAVNPFLHVQIHVMVEDQIAAGQPPEISEVLESFQAAGMTRHQAIHEIGKVLTLELHAALSEQRPFDSRAYGRALMKIRQGASSPAEPG
ncbi:MAG: DUF1841 family protein [Acidobacteriota bacterium]